MVALRQPRSRFAGGSLRALRFGGDFAPLNGASFITQKMRMQRRWAAIPFCLFTPCIAIAKPDL
jgi:hypothetical protein